MSLFVERMSKHRTRRLLLSIVKTRKEKNKSENERKKSKPWIQWSEIAFCQTTENEWNKCRILQSFAFDEWRNENSMGKNILNFIVAWAEIYLFNFVFVVVVVCLFEVIKNTLKNNIHNFSSFVWFVSSLSLEKVVRFFDWDKRRKI